MRLLAAEGSRAVVAAISRGAHAKEIPGYPRCTFALCDGPRVLARALKVRVHERVLVCETCRRAVRATDEQLEAATRCEAAFALATAEGRSPVRRAGPEGETSPALPPAARSPWDPPTAAEIVRGAPMQIRRRR